MRRGSKTKMMGRRSRARERAIGPEEGREE